MTIDDIDPIEEIHEIRRKLMKKAGGTPEAYVRHIMRQQKLNPDGLIDLSKPAAAQEKCGRNSAMPTAKASVRKPISHRKAVTVRG